MPARFDEQGIQFDFPENWKLDRRTPASGEVNVTVTSPETAFWSLSAFLGDVAPAEVLAEALQAMQAEYPTLEYDPAEERVEEHQLVGFDLNFFYLDLCNAAMVRGFRRDDTTYLLICQAEDREMERTAPVFRAMTASLLRDDDSDEL